MKRESGNVAGFEQQVGAERHLRSAEPGRATAQVVPGRELPSLVKFTVGGQIRLRDRTQ